ncbi:MAG TPA: hypothetical protein VG826_04790 [Pirellulales bacterium]|nr:hypothetical protein [Pirellulales bacterium]
MHIRQAAILGGALAALLVLARTSAAHFVLIYPEADDDRPVQTADATGLPPGKTRLGAAASSKNKKVVPRPQPSGKPESRVQRLKRERPKSETDPPKTRRRALGW